MSKNKDALFLCQFFHPEYITSAQLPYDAVLAIANAGYTVDVICGYPKEYNIKSDVPRKEQIGRMTINRLKYIQLKRSSFLGRIINYLSFTISVALRFLKMKNYHSIFVYSNPPILPIVAAMAKKIFKTSLVFINFDIYPEIAVKTGSITEGSLIYRSMVMANRFIYRHTDKVIAISGEMKNYILNNRPVRHADQIEVVPNWCHDNEQLTSQEPVSHPQLLSIKNNNRLIVSYFGNMGICQDMDTILDTIRLLSHEQDIHFLFAGHGSKLAMIRAATDAENLTNVTVFDYLHGQDFVDALRISDCFIASLVEGLAGLCVPSKIYSYLSASKPVITIMEEDYDIVKDIIKGKAGCFIKQGNAHELMNNLLTLRNDQHLITDMGQRGRKIYNQKYTLEVCTSQYVSILEDILHARGVK